MSAVNHKRLRADLCSAEDDELQATYELNDSNDPKTVAKVKRRIFNKLAPRSSLQFKIGPQFSDTFMIHNVLTSSGQLVTPIVSARIDRGFEKVEDSWVGYKRNYFTLVAAFDFLDMDLKEFLSETFTVVDNDNKEHPVKYFAIRLVSRCSEDGTAVNLVQHTAKRDRGPQFAPPTYPSIPGKLPNHNIVKEAANVRNQNKITKLNEIFYFNRQTQANEVDDISAIVDYPINEITKVARYERIQFASSINYRKPTANVKHFKLYVELVATTMENFDVLVAATETPPLIIRGRSPSNYRAQKQDKSIVHQDTATLNNQPDLPSNYNSSNIEFLPNDAGQFPIPVVSDNQGMGPMISVFTSLPSVSSNENVDQQSIVEQPKPKKVKPSATKPSKPKSSKKQKVLKKEESLTVIDNIESPNSNVLPFEMMDIGNLSFSNMHNVNEDHNYTYHIKHANEEQAEPIDFLVNDSFEQKMAFSNFIDFNLTAEKSGETLQNDHELELSAFLENSLLGNLESSDSKTATDTFQPKPLDFDFKSHISNTVKEPEINVNEKHEIHYMPELDELLENMSTSRPSNGLDSRDWADYDYPSFMAFNSSSHSIKT